MKHSHLLLGFGLLLAALLSPAAEQPGQNPQSDSAFTKSALLPQKQVTTRKLRQLQKEGYSAIVLMLEDSAEEQQHRDAAQAILDAGLQLHYFIEIGRNRPLADAHPEWMASLQTHNEWRRHFPKFSQDNTNTVVKVYPWVPALYEETFDEHLERVEAMLENLPRGKAIFLNDLQGAPSACGCGNSFCRWTTDYGDKLTAHPMGPEAAALFVAAVGRISPHSEIIPVWTTECAEHDGGKDAACAGVGCFDGACWKEYSRQIRPVAAQTRRVGVLLPLQDFPGKSRSGSGGQWQEQAIKSFWTTLPAKGGPNIPAERLVSVVQGWDISAADIEKQVARSKSLGVPAVVVAFTKIDQSWEPRIITYSPLKTAPQN